jgi:hypothetical protein
VAEVRLPHGPGPFRGPAPFAYARTLPRMPVTIPHAYASSPIRGNGVPSYGDGRSVRGCHADVMPTATSPLADRSPGSAGRHASPADQRYPLRDHLAPRPDESQREQADRFGHHCQSQNGDRPGQGFAFANGWWEVLLVACYLPLPLWGPLLLVLARAYYRRRCVDDVPSDG